MSKLNKDILFMLFEELQDDPKSLFSCLMVNRPWCETVIPVLWRNPWCYDINYTNNISLYNLILHYLPNNIKEYLAGQRIQIPPVSRQTMSFDYLSFCKSMNANVINNIIAGGASSAYSQFLLQHEIYSLFMRKIPELKYLDIRSIEHQIFYLPKAKIRLGSLYELICDTSIESAYFYGLASICNKIENLIIFNTAFKVNRGIVKLIDVQRNLKYFKWKDDLEIFDEECDIYKEIFLALAKKASTLTHFITDFQKYYGYTFPPEILSDFQNLKTLKLNFNSTITYGSNYDSQLKKSVYPNLEVLQLGSITYVDTVSFIAKNSGSQLRKMLIDNYRVAEEETFFDDSMELIRGIHQNCPFIEYLTLAFPSSDEHFVEFERLLNACQKLKALLIYTIYVTEISNEEMLANGERLLKAMSVSISLEEVRLFDDFKFSLKVLQDFFESRRGRPALSIFTSDHDYEERNYFDLIEKYKDDDVIKDFRCLEIEELYFGFFS